MRKAVHSLMAAALCVGAFTPAVYGADKIVGSGSTVFVMSNDAAKNEVLMYQSLPDGAFTSEGHFATGGRGSGGTTDPLASQGSLTLSQDRSLLFAVNSGSGTISSFHLLPGHPVLVDQEPTGGAFPVAVAEHNGTVYVLNAGGNGAIVPFRSDPSGRLHQISESTVRLTALNDGASSISVSPDGTRLVVIEKGPNNIDTFPIYPEARSGLLWSITALRPAYLTPRLRRAAL